MLVEKIKEFLLAAKRMRFRDARAWNASELTKDARDLYWSKTGEPETNPTDLTGHLKMRMGKWIEKGMVSEVLANLHMYGMHLMHGADEQVQIGGSAPVAVNGLLDGLLVERKGDQFGKTPWVLEIKTKYGAGASFIKNTFDPGESYMAQMGYYLKDLTEKGITSRGLFLFVLLGDNCFGEVYEIQCKYVVESDEVVAYRVVGIDGLERAIDHRLRMTPLLNRLEDLQTQIAARVLPPQDKTYKYPITEESLMGVSDTMLDKMRKGFKVNGDWEISYSQFRDKHLELQGGAGYSDAELELIHAEFARRLPERRAKRAKKSA